MSETIIDGETTAEIETTAKIEILMTSAEATEAAAVGVVEVSLPHGQLISDQGPDLNGEDPTAEDFVGDLDQVGHQDSCVEVQWGLEVQWGPADQWVGQWAQEDLWEVEDLEDLE